MQLRTVWGVSLHRDVKLKLGPGACLHNSRKILNQVFLPLEVSLLVSGRAGVAGTGGLWQAG